MLTQPAARLVFALRPDAEITGDPFTGRILLRAARRAFAVPSGPAAANALQMLRCGAGAEALHQAVSAVDPSWDPPRLACWLDALVRAGMVWRSIVGADGPIATVVPVAEAAARAGTAPPVVASGSYRLSRFAYCRAVAGDLALESPLARARVMLHGPACATLGPLAAGTSVEQLAHTVPALGIESAELLLSLLLEHELVAATEATEHAALATWEFHDLLFHARSRYRRDDGAAGATYRFIGQLEPLGAAKPPPAGQRVALVKPDVEALEREDVPFTRVLEGRRSLRTHGEPPITARELGGFLYRAARVRRIEDAGRMRISSRPYPSGGALYALELYMVVHRCDGLDPGVYQYDAAGHQACLVSAPNRATTALLRDAAVSCGQDNLPQILIVVTARFARAAWKYESIAYALLVKDLGCLMQTMYLVATAMNLAPCAVGAGDSELFGRASGIDALEEGAIGEFTLGRAGEQTPPPWAGR